MNKEVFTTSVIYRWSFVIYIYRWWKVDSSIVLLITRTLAVLLIVKSPKNIVNDRWNKLSMY